jgi:hypothetical protein
MDFQLVLNEGFQPPNLPPSSIVTTLAMIASSRQGTITAMRDWNAGPECSFGSVTESPSNIGFTPPGKHPIAGTAISA